MKNFKGWQQIGATMVLQAASSGSIFVAYSVVARPLQEEFQPSRMLLMMALTAVLIGSGVLSPLLGRAMERVSLRRMMMVGASLLGLGFIVVSRTQSMQQVLATYFVFMATAAVLSGPIAGSALLARWFTRRRGLAMSLSAAGAAVGGLIAPPLLQLLIEALEWRTAFLVYGIGLLVLTLPVVALLVIDRPSVVGQYPDGASAEVDQPSPVGDTPGIGYYLRDRNFWLLGIVLGLLFASSMGITANLLQFTAERGVDAARGAFLLSVFAGSNFVGKLASGALADRYNPKLLLTVIILLFTAAVFGFTQVEVYGLFVVASAVLGVSQGGIVPLWSVLMARLYGPERVGSSMGMMSMVLTPFNLVAPPLFGLVADRTGTYVGAYMGSIGLLLFSLLLVGLIREHRSGGT